jgi:hypothetical protein
MSARGVVMTSRYDDGEAAMYDEFFDTLLDIGDAEELTDDEINTSISGSRGKRWRNGGISRRIQSWRNAVMYGEKH